MDLNFLLLAGILSILLGMVGALLYFNFKKARYSEKENRALLESIRFGIERQIYGLNERLIQNEERWRDVNHLLLRGEYLTNESAFSIERKIFYSEFLKANGITENDLIIDNRLIFVLTPFHDDHYDEYKVIRETCSALGFKCVRGDESQYKSDIFAQVLKLIVKSRLIIANINGRSPNVLYELGISQALDKNIILVSKSPKELPVDIKSKRFLIYEKEVELSEQLRKELLELK